MFKKEASRTVYICPINVKITSTSTETHKFFERIFFPLLGLSWKTEIYRPEDLRPGPFSIRLIKIEWTVFRCLVIFQILSGYGAHSKARVGICWGNILWMNWRWYFGPALSPMRSTLTIFLTKITQFKSGLMQVWVVFWWHLCHQFL